MVSFSGDAHHQGTREHTHTRTHTHTHAHTHTHTHTHTQCRLHSFLPRRLIASHARCRLESPAAELGRQHLARPSEVGRLLKTCGVCPCPRASGLIFASLLTAARIFHTHHAHMHTCTHADSYVRVSTSKSGSLLSFASSSASLSSSKMAHCRQVKGMHVEHAHAHRHTNAFTRMHEDACTHCTSSRASSKRRSLRYRSALSSRDLTLPAVSLDRLATANACRVCTSVCSEAEPSPETTREVAHTRALARTPLPDQGTQTPLPCGSGSSSPLSSHAAPESDCTQRHQHNKKKGGRGKEANQ